MQCKVMTITFSRECDRKSPYNCFLIQQTHTLSMRIFLKWLFHTASTEGIQPLLFRLWYIFCCRSGLMRLRFPHKNYTAIRNFAHHWQHTSSVFFDFPESGFSLEDVTPLKKKMEGYRQGKFLYFQKIWYLSQDWHGHPVTGSEFDRDIHWSGIRDISAQGDIKYIWEKSRFSFIYDFIRYGHYTGEDTAKEVFSLIDDWIRENPVNRGPNWMCSQEISIRVLNWFFVLFYFRNSPVLTDHRVNIILQSITDQMQHVWSNRRFARYLVRNNHVLSESLALYVTGVLMPFLPESNRWEKEGKATFENEIMHQIYEDGTYLQFSMNYHRMALQLLSWHIQFSKINNRAVRAEVKERAGSSVRFLRHCMDEQTGRLPNYGHNDGTLLFPFSDCDYTDFRPQIAAAAAVLGISADLEKGKWEEEAVWITGKVPDHVKVSVQPETEGCHVFRDSGYYVMKQADTMTFVRCGSYKHRPAQADNLHVDLWADGENIMRDGGSFLYNSDPETLQYFMGTPSHNTVMLNNEHQMEKGPRFVWFDWIKYASGECYEDREHTVFNGKYEGFRSLGKGIIHSRKVIKSKDRMHWKIIDEIKNAPQGTLYQLTWHPMSGFFDKYALSVFSENGEMIGPQFFDAWFSPYYGFKEPAQSVRFSALSAVFISVIEKKTKNAHTVDVTSIRDTLTL